MRFRVSCDLLENSYFCSIANNQPLVLNVKLSVVICLKTRTFAVSQTTQLWKLVERLCCDLLENSYFCSIANNEELKTFPSSVLWFAWKLVLLQYRKQQEYERMVAERCCDLLENSYFCSIANNKPFCTLVTNTVVICLKTRTFAVSQTTDWRKFPTYHLLWFAWKLVLLQYRKQLITKSSLQLGSCDLLENSYFCSIANNPP